MPCDIAIVLKEVVKLLRASIPSTIEIVQKIPSNLGTVMADQTQIHQVLMNLVHQCGSCHGGPGWQVDRDPGELFDG